MTTTPNLRDNAELRAALEQIFCERPSPTMGANRVLGAVQAALTPEAAPEQPRPAFDPGPTCEHGRYQARCLYCNYHRTASAPAPASVPTPATCDFCKVEWATCPHGLRGSRV
jgi:hypothetical protein